MGVYVLGFIAVLGGGLLGIRRQILLLLIGGSSFLSFILYRSGHGRVIEALEVFNLADDTAWVLSFVITVLIPFFVSLYVAIKFLVRLGIADIATTIPEETLTVVDKMLGAGFALGLYLLLIYIMRL